MRAAQLTHSPTTCPPNRGKAKHGHFLTANYRLTLFADETRWAIKNKLTERTEPVNYLNHLYLDAMKAVSPATVTIIH